jgi:hypothetical protein
MMRKGQKFDKFLNHMLTYEGLLSHKPHAEGDDTQKIDFWYTRLPAQLKKKLIQKNLDKKVKAFNEFCTHVRYCEQLEETMESSNTNPKRRRNTDGTGHGGKRKEGRTPSDRSNNNNNGGSTNQGSQNLGGNDNAPSSHTNRNQNGGGWNRGRQSEGNKPKDH